MNEDLYFVILNSDGDTRVAAYTKKDLLEKLAEDYWGRTVMREPDFVDSDTNYWGKHMLIIKGTVAKVTPPGDWRVE